MLGIKRGELNERGEAKCNCCGKKTTLENMELCMECDKFSCKACVKYRRQFPYGYTCQRCMERLKQH